MTASKSLSRSQPPSFRYCELRRAEGRTIGGVAVRYGDTAEIWGVRESIAAGAFGANVAGQDILLNVAHDRGRAIARTPQTLTLKDSAVALEIEAQLPMTREADDALALIDAKILRGLSIEFIPETVNRSGEDSVVVERARLLGVAVVDTPAYPASSVYGRWLEETVCAVNEAWRLLV